MTLGSPAAVSPGRRPGPGAAASPGGAAPVLEDLARFAARDPDAVAVICVRADGREQALTWGGLRDESAALAARLLALGVAPGEPVAYQLPNRLEFFTVTLAALRIGAVACPLMPIFRERELGLMLREAAARVLFVPATHRGRDPLALAEGLRPQLPALEAVIAVPDMALAAGDADATALGEPLLADALAALAGRRPRGADIAQLLFTSGSTGDPKGVLHRHDVLTRAADAHIAHFGLDERDVIFVPSPLAHQTGFLYGMWIALRLGVTAVALERWDPTVGLDAIRRHGVTFAQAATPFLADLVDLVDAGAPAPDTLRLFVATGAAVPRALAGRARATLRAEVGGGFGTTESCMGAGFVPGLEDERAWTTDGRALAGVRLRVVDPDTGHELGPDTEGVFELRSDTLFDGYLHRPEATAAAFSAGGWYRPGDLATLDRDGYLRITGRVRDVINRGGEKVPVAEIEELLYRHPAVAEVAIVAMPDPRLGERACAFVVAAPGVTLSFVEMQDHLDEHQVAKPYWPERLEIVPELPRTPSGKIQKFRLRETARDFDDVHRKATA